MIRYTTPTLTLRVPLDISEAKIVVSLRQGKTQLDKEISKENVTVQHGNTVISVKLTQEETGNFNAGTACTAQVNWIYEDNTRDASQIKKKIDIDDNLLSEVLSYE